MVRNEASYRWRQTDRQRRRLEVRSVSYTGLREGPVSWRAVPLSRKDRGETLSSEVSKYVRVRGAPYDASAFQRKTYLTGLGGLEKRVAVGGQGGISHFDGL